MPLQGIPGLVCKPSIRIGLCRNGVLHIPVFCVSCWRIIMNASDMRSADRFERIASSGCVFRGESAVKADSKNFPVNGILFRLIEEELELSFRSQNCLNNAGIKLIGQLAQKTESELLALKNCGRRSLGEIEDALADMGLTLGMNLDFPPWRGNTEDADLIRILSLQRMGGGFHLGHQDAEALGIDLEKLKATTVKLSNSMTADRRLILSTALILKCLEERYQKGNPYLVTIIQRNRQWLKKQLKQDSKVRFMKDT